MCGWRLPLLCLMCCSSNAVRAEVSIRVDGTRTRQTVEGFGATTMSLVYEGPLGDTLSPELRRQAVEAAYGQVKLNGGNLNVNFVRPVHNAAQGGRPRRTVSRLSYVWLGGDEDEACGSGRAVGLHRVVPFAENRNPLE